VVRLYEEYKDKGFDIIGVSLDRNERGLGSEADRKEWIDLDTSFPIWLILILQQLLCMQIELFQF